MGNKIKKHPMVEACDKWLKYGPGSDCSDPSSLHAPKNQQVYLENRLHQAFMAGARAQEKIFMDRIKELFNVG